MIISPYQHKRCSVSLTPPKFPSFILSVRCDHPCRFPFFFDVVIHVKYPTKNSRFNSFCIVSRCPRVYRPYCTHQHSSLPICTHPRPWMPLTHIYIFREISPAIRSKPCDVCSFLSLLALFLRSPVSLCPITPIHTHICSERPSPDITTRYHFGIVFWRILRCLNRWPIGCLRTRFVCLPVYFGVSTTNPNLEP